MDSRRFDHLARLLSAAGSRRGLVGHLIALPLLGGLASFSSEEETAAKERRRRRKQRHKKRKNPGTRKANCKPQGKGKVCAGKCGPIKSRQTCGKTVDCGSCACDPPCDACSVCDAGTQSCTSQCQAAETCCDAACADLQTDAGNCGTCGNACGEGQNCQGGVCGVACGSSFCPAASEICVEDSCQACNVTCTGSAAECGAALQTALEGSEAALYVCPGRYQGGFSIGRNVTVIGAGEGEDPASSTILDGNDTQRVLEMTSGEVVLQRLHITRGEPDAGGGGGVRNNGATLTIQDCTVAHNAGRGGGGINHQIGFLAMTRCTVRDNESLSGGVGPSSGGGLRLTRPAMLTDCLVTGNTTDGGGGGIYLSGGGEIILAGQTRVERNTAERGGGLYVSLNCGATIGAEGRVTGNTATAGIDLGGGIYNLGGAVTLEGSDPSPIVTGNCHENCVGNVPKCQPGGTCPAAP